MSTQWPISPSRPHRGAWLFYTGLFTIACGLPALGQLQRRPVPINPPAQIQPVQLRLQSPEDSMTGLGLPRAPREMRRALTRAERAIQDGRFADAVEWLSEILQKPRSEDYFLLDDEESDVPQSLKGAARDLLGTLPAAGREIYELQAGSTAKRLLEEAIKARSFQQLNEVSRRYFHTQAGYQATYLLGRFCLDQDRPVAAAMQFQRLRDVGMASHDFEPDLSFYLATSWLLADNAAAAEEALQYLRTLQPGVVLEIAGQKATLPIEPAPLVPWLEGMVRDLASTMSPLRHAWVMYRGEPDRNGTFQGDFPIPKLEWAVEPTALPDYADLVDSELRMMDSQRQPPLAALHPLAVGNTVLMRTPHMLFGVDLDSGKRVWQYPWDTPAADPTSIVAYPYQPPQENPIQTFVRQRMWQDGVHGQLSCNESTVFLLQDLSPLGSVMDAGAQFNLLRRGLAAVPPALKDNANQLIALDLNAEGKTRWIVGGKDGEAPELASAFFLGAPLPLDDYVYVMAELQDEIRLCALRAHDGEVEWTQQIAQVESPFAWYLDAVRRLAGCSPSYADGVMICPTSSGLVVALDVAARSLLWSYQYPRDATTDAGGQRFQQLQTASSSMPPLGERWADNAVLIVDGKVVMTPIDSTSLHCLDLLTGKRLWTSRRSDYLYVAGVHDGTVVLVGEDTVQGLRLSDGDRLWEPVKLPDGVVPSGQGFLSGPMLYLPTTASELLLIDVAAGQLKERIPTDEVLGNLICHKDYIISQSATGVRAFLRRDRARVIVEQRLKEDGTDLATWETYGSLLLGEGKTDEAIDAMRHAWQLAEHSPAGESVRKNLVGLLLQRLEQGDKSVDLDEIERLARSIDERKRFHRVMIEHLTAAGDVEAAIDHCVSRWMLMAERATEAQPPLVVAGPDWKVSEPVWLRQRFEQLFEQLPAESRQQAVQRIHDEVRRASDAGGLSSADSWSGSLPAAYHQAHPWLEQDDIDELFGQGRFLLVQLRLLPLLESKDAETRVAALAKLVRLYRVTGAQQLATAALERLRAEAPAGEPDWVSNIIDELPGNATEQAPATPYDEWPTGSVTFEELDIQVGQLRPPVPVELRSAAGWPENWRLAYDQQENRLEIRNELGNIVRVANLPPQRIPLRIPTYARAYGQLIVFNMVNRVVAVDAIGDQYDQQTRVLWSSDDESLFPGMEVAHSPILSAPRPTGPFNQARMVAAEVLGPVTAAGVCFVHNDSLRCVDPLTGRTVWLRENLLGERNQRFPQSQSMEIYGDEGHVFVQSTSRSGRARVFRMLDGADLGEVAVPQQQWARRGRMILAWKQSYGDGATTLSGYDPLEATTLWTVTLPRGSTGVLVEDDELATLTPEGQLEIRRIEDGQVRIERQLDGPPVVPGGLRVLRNADDYLIVISDRAVRQHWVEEERTITVMGAAAIHPPPPLVSGIVLAIDRATGADRWSSPLEVRDFFLPEDQPPGIPFIGFMRAVAVDVKSAPQQRNQQQRMMDSQFTDVAIVDRRDGDVIFLKRGLRNISRMFTMTADSPNAQLSILLQPRKGIRLTVTDEPRLESTRLLPSVTGGGDEQAAGEEADAPLREEGELNVPEAVPQ